jgi:glycosyltransferase involved in cell wall biosynthesis
LAKAHVDVTVVSIALPGSPSREVIDGVRVVRVDPFRYRSGGFVTWVLNFNEEMIEETMQLIRDGGDFDILHVHDWLTGPAGIALKHLLHRPLVVTVHATEVGRRGGIHSEDGRVIHWWEWRTTYEAWRVIVCSNYMVNEVRRIHGVPLDKLRMIPNGVDLEYIDSFRAGGDFRSRFALPNERIIVFVGRLVHEKGVDLVLHAFRELLRWNWGIKLVVVGDGPMREYLMGLASQWGIWSKVYFTGKVGDDVLYPLLRIADLAILPSRYEPFGITILETMATGLPVITTDTGGPGEIIRNWVNGVKVPPNDVHSMVEAAKVLLSNEELRRRIGSAGRETVATQYTWDRIARWTLRAYSEVLEEYSRTDWRNRWR